MRASEKPDRRDRQRTMGSRANISKGRPQVARISLMEKRFSLSSFGPHMFSPVALRLFFASRSRMIVERVSGTRKKWASWTAPPRISWRCCEQLKVDPGRLLKSPAMAISLTRRRDLPESKSSSAS